MLLSDVADRAASYGMPSEICDGMDALHVRDVTQRAVERARTGGGPTLIEAKTYRYYDHQGVKGLRKSYRTQEEVEQWRERDAIEGLQRLAIDAGLVTQDEFDQTWAEVQADAAEAIEFARTSPMPDVKDFDRNVYSH
jgi:pyruvate dehydrogenase E1 component alpha subunit